MNFSTAQEILVVMLLAVLWMIPLRIFLGFFERKLVADFQARIGPNQSGVSGAFQGVFDFLRLLQKEVGSGIPLGESLSFSFVFAATLVSLYGQIYPNFSVDFLLPFTLQLLGVVLSAVSVRDQWMEGLRRCALAAVGIVPVMLGVICVGLQTGSGGFHFPSTAMGAENESAIHAWNLFSNPFLFLAGLSFFLGSYQLFIIQTQQESGLVPPLSSITKRYLGGGVGGDLQILEGMIRFLCRLNLGIWFSLLFLGGWKEYSLPILSWLAFSVKVSAVYLAMRFFGVIGAEQKILQRLSQGWRLTFALGFVSVMGQVVWRWVVLS